MGNARIDKLPLEFRQGAAPAEYCRHRHLPVIPGSPRGGSGHNRFASDQPDV